MNHHLGILEEGIEAISVLRDGAAIESERRRGEVEDKEEEELDTGEGRRIG